MKFLAPLALLVAFAGTASASDLCNVPEAEWQPTQALQAKLQSEGWTVRSIEVDDGCYEAYGTDQAGRKQEVYFDPKTFEVVRSKSES